MHCGKCQHLIQCWHLLVILNITINQWQIQRILPTNVLLLHWISIPVIWQWWATFTMIHISMHQRNLFPFISITYIPVTYTGQNLIGHFYKSNGINHRGKFLPVNKLPDVSLVMQQLVQLACDKGYKCGILHYCTLVAILTNEILATVICFCHGLAVLRKKCREYMIAQTTQ